MTQEYKDLLLKDLCARLPYGVKVMCETEKSIFEVEAITSYNCVCPKDKNYLHNIDDDKIKPCLFPLDKIRGDMWSEYLRTCVGGNASFPTLKSFEWCNKHHVDYRGLIPMGLATDATNLNIY